MLLAVLAGSAWTAGAATAGEKIYAPPGKAGSSQYAEVIPSSGGNVSTPALGGGGNTTPTQISALGAGRIGVKRLSKLGKAGAGAAQFAQVTAPVRLPAARATPRRGVQGTTSTLGNGTAGSALTALTDLLGGSDAGGIGVLLPLLLAFAAGAAITAGVQRARRGQPPA